MEDEIQTLLDELSSFEMPQTNTKRALHDDKPLNQKDVQQYFLDKTKAVIEASVGAVQDLTVSTTAGGDSRDVDALAKLIASTAQMLDTLNKSSLIDKKADRDEQLEMLRIEGRKQLAQLTQGPKQITNNNVMITSREEIMKQLDSIQTNTEVLELKNK
jgi:hypothetical protein